MKVLVSLLILFCLLVGKTSAAVKPEGARLLAKCARLPEVDAIFPIILPALFRGFESKGIAFDGAIITDALLFAVKRLVVDGRGAKNDEIMPTILATSEAFFENHQKIRREQTRSAWFESMLTWASNVEDLRAASASLSGTDGSANCFADALFYFQRTLLLPDGRRPNARKTFTEVLIYCEAGAPIFFGSDRLFFNGGIPYEKIIDERAPLPVLSLELRKKYLLGEMVRGEESLLAGDWAETYALAYGHKFSGNDTWQVSSVSVAPTQTQDPASTIPLRLRMVLRSKPGDIPRAIEQLKITAKKLVKLEPRARIEFAEIAIYLNSPNDIVFGGGLFRTSPTEEGSDVHRIEKLRSVLDVWERIYLRVDNEQYKIPLTVRYLPYVTN